MINGEGDRDGEYCLDNFIIFGLLQVLNLLVLSIHPLHIFCCNPGQVLN